MHESSKALRLLLTLQTFDDGRIISLAAGVECARYHRNEKLAPDQACVFQVGSAEVGMQPIADPRLLVPLQAVQPVLQRIEAIRARYCQRSRTGRRLGDIEFILLKILA